MNYAQISADGLTVINIIVAADGLTEWAGLELDELGEDPDRVTCAPGWARVKPGVYAEPLPELPPEKLVTVGGVDFLLEPSKTDPTEFVLKAVAK